MEDIFLQSQRFAGASFRIFSGREASEEHKSFYRSKYQKWPKFDEEWHKGGEWIEPTEKAAQSTAKQKTVTKRKYRAR